MKEFTIDGSDRNDSKRFSEAKSEISFNFANSDLAGAEEFAANFPKYCKAKFGGVSAKTWGMNQGEGYQTVSFDVWLGTNNVTGDVNETAVKRRLKVLAVIEKLGL